MRANISSGFFATAAAIQLQQIHDEPDEGHALKRGSSSWSVIDFAKAWSVVVASPRLDKPPDGISE